MDTRILSPNLSIASQIQVDDMKNLATRFRSIINNRPDHEEAGQPDSSEIAAEAARLGLAYRHIPVVPGQFGEGEAQAFATALDELEAPVLAFCRSGTRSAMLFDLASRTPRTDNGTV